VKPGLRENTPSITEDFEGEKGACQRITRSDIVIISVN